MEKEKEKEIRWKICIVYLAIMIFLSGALVGAVIQLFWMRSIH